MERISYADKLRAAKVLGDPRRPIQTLVSTRQRKEPGVPGKEGNNSESLRERSRRTAKKRAGRFVLRSILASGSKLAIATSDSE